MKKLVSLALLHKAVEDAIKKVEVPEGARGPRGFKGIDGNDFNLDDHKESILSLIVDNIPKEIVLTAEQKEELRGPRGFAGLNGVDGKDGLDGKDFNFEEHREIISSIIEEHSLTFDKLTAEQISQLRGPQGLRGKDGKDFNFDESQDAINEIIIKYLGQIRDTLALKFSDLTEDEIYQLQGPRGPRGKDGKDFDFQENKEDINKALSHFLGERIPELKLKFQDLTQEDKEELKLKFSDLSDDEKFSLRGPRGQKGKKGDDGERGENGESAYELALLNGFKGTEAEFLASLVGPRGKRGPVGAPGVVGRTGRDGRDGIDGKDAPQIDDVKLEKEGNSVAFVFRLTNGERLKTNYVTLPRTNVSQYITNVLGGGSSQGGGDGRSAYELAVDNGFLGDLTQWLESLKGDPGAKGDTGEIGDAGKSAYELAVDKGFVGDEADFLASLIGAKGDPGPAGKSAYEIAVDNGFVGNEQDFLDSLKGADGSSGGTSSPITVIDETTPVSTNVKNISFVGEYVTVLPISYMWMWPTLSAVPTLETYTDSNVDSVIVRIEPPDSSLIKNIPCDSDVFVGAFVRMTNSGIAKNAIADIYENANVIGVVERKPTSTTCDIRVSGISSAIFLNLDTSKDYFLSDVDAGLISETIPTESGHIKLRLGQAFSSSQFLFAKGDRVVRV